VRSDRAAPAQGFRSVQLLQGLLGGIRIIGIAADNGNASLETNNLPGAGLPSPRRFQWAESSGGNILAVDLQRLDQPIDRRGREADQKEHRPRKESR